MLEELDGLVAGVLVCPEMIRQANGFPSSGARLLTRRAVFDTADHLNKVLTLVMAHYNDVAKRLFEKAESLCAILRHRTIATVTFCGSCGSRGSKRP